MKVFWVAILILVIICILIGSHSYIMTHMGKSIAEINKKIEKAAHNEEWKAVSALLNEAQEEWDRHSFWASLTISTEDIEQLEIALNQAKTFAQIEQKADFFGEFVMFSMLVEHIPHREGFHIEEVL